MKQPIVTLLLSASVLFTHAQEVPTPPMAEQGKLYFRMAVGSMHALNPLLQDNFYDVLVWPGDNALQLQLLQFTYFYAPHFGVEINVPAFIGLNNQNRRAHLIDQYISDMAPGFLNPNRNRHDYNEHQSQTSIGQAALLFAYRNTFNKWSITTAIGPGMAFYNFGTEFFDIKQQDSHRLDQIGIVPANNANSGVFFMGAGNISVGYWFHKNTELSLECNMRYVPNVSYEFVETRRNRLSSEFNPSSRSFQGSGSILNLGWSLGFRVAMVYNKKKRLSTPVE